MAKSRYATAKQFELDDRLLPRTFLVVRIDGRCFTRFCDDHAFTKPNDMHGLALMDRAAQATVRAIPEALLAYGHSDEYSFLLGRSCCLFGRRAAKILTTFVSTFTAHYLFHWNELMASSSGPLLYPPTFDGRLIQYPGPDDMRGYFSWRQADCHVNNLYNTVFWALVKQGGHTEREAHEMLKGTLARDKHEILFTQFSINYNDEPEACRKGSVFFRTSEKALQGPLHVDIIQEGFWKEEMAGTIDGD